MTAVTPLPVAAGFRHRSAGAQAGHHPVQRLSHWLDPGAGARRVCRGLRFGSRRFADRAGQRAASSHQRRHLVSRSRPDAGGRARRPCRLVAAVPSLEPQNRHADRGSPQHVFHPADPVGAECRAADRTAPLDRDRIGVCHFGSVPDCRRADAGTAPSNLWGDLRSHAGERLYPVAVHQLFSRRKRVRL